MNRKVVKQTVMTIVYGVTFVGGRLQIEKQLKDLDVRHEILFKGSSYLVNQVFKSIGELFTSARKIQVGYFVIKHMENTGLYYFLMSNN